MQASLVFPVYTEPEAEHLQTVVVVLPGAGVTPHDSLCPLKVTGTRVSQKEQQAAASEIGAEEDTPSEQVQLAAKDGGIKKIKTPVTAMAEQRILL